MAHRIERVNSLIRREISELIQRQVKDPRVDHSIAVTEVSTSPDLKHAKVFVSCLVGQEERLTTLNTLVSASGFFRRELSKRLKMRRIPELSFQWDNSIERGEQLLKLIDQVSSEHDPIGADVGRNTEH